MKTLTTTNRQTHWMAGTAAALGTLLTMGGSLGLAEYYAQSGACPEPSGYYAAERTGRPGCAQSGNLRTAVTSPERGAARTPAPACPKLPA